MATRFRWEGNIIAAKARRAYGRGLIGIGEAIANDGKRNAHVVSGTMRRSIHTAPLGWTGGDDASVATSSDVANTPVATAIGVDAALEVGSWMPYACVEEVGRGHAFMAPAVEEVSGARAEALMRQAFAEEGLL